MQLYLPWFIATAAASALAAVLVVELLRRGHQPTRGVEPLPADWDLLPRPVFTADERRVYRQLREALPHHIVLAKLPLVRFCQPNDPKRVHYWYELLGANHVSFAICSANGRVLAALDLSYDRGGPPSRSTRIKRSVLGACRVRYLRCPADHLPSIPELQLLVPQSTNASRGPHPARATSAMPGATPGSSGGVATSSRRRERATLWQDSMAFHDSFFSSDRGFLSGHGDLLPLDSGPGLPAGMVVDEPPPSPLRH